MAGNTFGTDLKESAMTLTDLRLRAKMSKASVARAVGLSNSTIAAWEKGAAPVPDARIAALAKALGAAPADVAEAAREAIKDRVTGPEQMLRDVSALIRSRVGINQNDLETTIVTLRAIAALDNTPSFGRRSDRVADRASVVCKHADYVARHLAGDGVWSATSDRSPGSP